MKETIVDSAMLKQKSEELEIHFSNLLAGYILEEIMYLIYQSGFKDHLWLVNSQILGLEQYRKRNELILRFKYCRSEKKLEPNQLVPGQKLSRLLGLAMIAYIFGGEQKSAISWKGNAIEKESSTREIGNSSHNKMQVEIYLNATLEDREVPVYLEIEDVEYENLIPDKKEFQMLKNRNQVVKYLQYPSETILAENLFEIMEKMELVPDMKAFETVYQILTEQAMNGRHVLEILVELCEEKPVVKKEERLTQIENYADYSYMRKRWEKYLRHQKRKEPEWHDVMKIFLSFMRPIWHAVCVDEIFFDDWMPGIERFLG